MPTLYGTASQGVLTHVAQATWVVAWSERVRRSGRARSLRSNVITIERTCAASVRRPCVRCG